MTLHRFVEKLTPVLSIAHRGGAKLFPENTMLAFEGALTQFKCDMLELDVRSSSDGEVVVFHDETLERTTDGQGNICDHSWTHLSRLDAGFHFQNLKFRAQNIGLSRFEEVLQKFPSILMNVEIKDAVTVEPFVQLMKRFPTSLEYMCIGSQLDSVALHLRELMPQACLFYPENALAECVITAKTQNTFIRNDTYQVLDMPMFWDDTLVFDAAFSALAKQANKWVNVWTVDEVEHMKLAISNGVGGIMTDRPDLLAHVLKS